MKQLILLNHQDINEQLKQHAFTNPYTLHLFSSIDSTNRYLKDLASSSLLEICCAESQTRGRGRFGKVWHSPFGENIYCSTRWNVRVGLPNLRGLSLVISLAVLASIQKYIDSNEIKVKWPNDIFWRDKKLSGSLIEIMAESNGNIQIIIGIGLNVNTDTQQNPLKEKPWCSLFEIAQQEFNRNQLIATVLKHLESYLHRFLSHGLDEFLSEWGQYDYLAGKEITVTQTHQAMTGLAIGVNPMGQLILEDAYGGRHYLSSGDTSCRVLEFCDPNKSVEKDISLAL